MSRWPGSTTTLVGRDREVEVVTDAVHAAALGHGRVILVEGEPGIGKSRLIDQACDQARIEGCEVARGGCDDFAPPRPFAPLLDALAIRPDASDPGRARIAALVDDPELPAGEPLPASPNPGLQFRVVEALGALVEGLAARAPLLLAVDDLQWADAATLVALRSIARRVATLPVVVVGAFRSGHDVAELHRVADDLLRAGAHLLSLAPLDDASVVSLVTEVLDASPSSDLLERVRGASGNPLFVIEYLRSIESASDDADATVAATSGEFRATIVRRLATLPATTGDSLRLASILGSSFSLSDLAVASGRTVVDLAPALHHAVVGAMLEERGHQLAFRHVLVRDAIYEHMPLAVRRQLHREVGRALAAAGSNALVVAHHLGLGADAGDLEAVGWMRRAAREAAARSPGVAVELLRRAEDLLGPASGVRDELQSELAVALAWSGRLAEAEALSIDVLARRPDSSVGGPLRCGLVYALTWQGRAQEALRHASVGPDETLDERDAVLLQAEAAVASVFAFDLRAGASLGAAAAAEAERLGHTLALCHALTALSWAANFAGRAPEAVDLARRAIDLADRDASGTANLAHPRFFPGMPLLYLDRVEEAEETLRSGRRVAEALGLAWSLPLYHALLGARGYIAGDWDGAIAEFETTLAVADEVGLHIGVIAATSAWLAVIQLHRDDLEAAERTLANAIGRLADKGTQLGMGVLNWARALVHEARHEPDQALAILQAAWDLYMAGGPEPDPRVATGPMTDPWTAMAFVRLCVATGDRPRARRVLPAIDEQARALGTPFMQGQAMRCRALVDQDPDLLVEALPLYRASRRRNELAAASEDAAGLLAAANRLDEALPLWDEATELWEGLGADRDLARIASHLRAAGIKRGARQRRVRATAGWESLTTTEHRVISLVAQRLSNPEVADRLFISRHTVESHLKHVYRKLGVSSRLELAEVAVRHAEEAVH
ncbi:MAG TPA: AAA family ATPase [Acidimicrobiales bacterium]|nr:AAA family ATPase [Acidimicrobiales bacterium]